MRIDAPKEILSLPNLKLAVIGHVEWVTFLKVDQLPLAGQISHAKDCFEEAAGGAAVAAVQIAKLINGPVDLITSLGKDNYGEKCYERLTKLGLNLKVAWREKPTRKGISLISKDGERAITVIGERLSPTHIDKLEWNILKKMDGIFITASDSEIFKMARSASILCTTPRVGLNTINQSNVLLDGLIGSNLDPGEVFSFSDLSLKPKYTIKTEGDKGGIIFPGGRYKALKNKKLKVDSYGCGDSFAAGILYGMASKWDIDKSLNLAKIIGRDASEFFGPYAENEEK